MVVQERKMEEMVNDKVAIVQNRGKETQNWRKNAEIEEEKIIDAQNEIYTKVQNMETRNARKRRKNVIIRGLEIGQDKSKLKENVENFFKDKQCRNGNRKN